MTPTAIDISDKTRVLLVDDNDVHQYALSRHLTDAGFAVVSAKTGQEAVRLAQQEQPHVVLLDLHLPDAIGFEVGRTLKEDEATRTIPLVFFSATHDTQAAKASANGLGAVAFLTYPIDVDHLITVVRAAVARSRAAQTTLPR